MAQKDYYHLERQVSEAVVGRIDPTLVEGQLRSRIRSHTAEGNGELVFRLRLLLGKLLLMEEKPEEAARQFRVVAKSGTYRIEALLGLGESYVGRGKLATASGHFTTALRLAIDREDYLLQLSALDALAFIAGQERQGESEDRLLAQMRDLVDRYPILEHYPLTAVHALLDRNNGSVATAVPYIEAVARRLSVSGSHRGAARAVMLLLVEAYRQIGYSDDHIRSAIQAWGGRSELAE